MYPAGPGSGDSPEGLPEQPSLQPQIGNRTTQTLGTETGCIIQSLLQSLFGAEDWGRETGEERLKEVAGWHRSDGKTGLHLVTYALFNQSTKAYVVASSASECRFGRLQNQ